MIYFSEPAPKRQLWVTALGVMTGHGLALAVLLWGWMMGEHVFVLCCGIATCLLALVLVGWDHLTLLLLAGTASVRGAGLRRACLGREIQPVPLCLLCKMSMYIG